LTKEEIFLSVSLNRITKTKSSDLLWTSIHCIIDLNGKTLEKWRCHFSRVFLLGNPAANFRPSLPGNRCAHV